MTKTISKEDKLKVLRDCVVRVRSEAFYLNKNKNRWFIKVPMKSQYKSCKSSGVEFTMLEGADTVEERIEWRNKKLKEFGYENVKFIDNKTGYVYHHIPSKTAVPKKEKQVVSPRGFELNGKLDRIEEKLKRIENKLDSFVDTAQLNAQKKKAYEHIKSLKEGLEVFLSK